MPEDKELKLPDKIYFKIGEVAEIVGVEPYVLRYWESEFPALRPIKSKSQQRMYRKKDVELLLRIKKLLYEDMYTIAGAKKQLARGGDKQNGQMSLKLPASEDKGLLRKVEREIQAILKLLEEK